MTEIISFTLLDMAYCLGALTVTMIIFAIVKSYLDNRRFEKHIYKILEQYREKYGYDRSCENLLFVKNDNGDDDD